MDLVVGRMRVPRRSQVQDPKTTIAPSPTGKINVQKSLANDPQNLHREYDAYQCERAEKDASETSKLQVKIQ